MKIAFFHELHFGGARRVVLDYGKVFSRGHDITLYYVNSVKEKDSEDVFPKHYYYRFDALSYKGGSWIKKLFKDFVEPLSLYLLHKKIAKEIDSMAYDFVFVHQSQFTHAPFLLRFLKTKSVYYCQEPLRTVYDPLVAVSKDLPFFKRVYELLVRQWKKYIDKSNIDYADLVVTNCDFSRRNIKNAYGIEATTCYLGVDPTLFKPIKIKKEYDLLLIGADAWLDGSDTLEEICKLFPQRPVVFRVKQQKGKHISDAELVRHYNKAKVVLTLGRFDPFSMIPLEANSCGVCPVVVREGGPIEAVENGKTGYLVKRDPDAFYMVINNLLENERLRDEIGKNGRKKIETFWNWEQSSERLFAAISKSGILT